MPFWENFGKGLEIGFSFPFKVVGNGIGEIIKPIGSEVKKDLFDPAADTIQKLGGNAEKTLGSLFSPGTVLIIGGVVIAILLIKS